MKTVTRIGAIVSFLCCLLGGVWLLRPALGGAFEDGFVLASAGVSLIGVGVFLGLLLWLAGEKCLTRQEGR
ncbi:MAG: hypothetical protein ACKVYV_12940 [Limisphaerales bacterium]